VPDYANVVVKVVAILGVIYRVPAATTVHNVFCYYAVAHILTHWCKRRGCRDWECKHTPKVLIWWKSFNIRAKSLKTCTNSVKVWAKMAPNIFWFEKTGAQFSRKFVRIRAKIIRTPKNLPVPTPMSLTPWVNLAFRPESGFKNKCRSRARFGLMISGSGWVKTSK